MIVVLASGALKHRGIPGPAVAVLAYFDFMSSGADAGVLLLGLLFVAGHKGMHLHDEFPGGKSCVFFLEHPQEGVEVVVEGLLPADGEGSDIFGV